MSSRWRLPWSTWRAARSRCTRRSTRPVSADGPTIEMATRTFEVGARAAASPFPPARGSFDRYWDSYTNAVWCWTGRSPSPHRRTSSAVTRDRSPTPAPGRSSPSWPGSPPRSTAAPCSPAPTSPTALARRTTAATRPRTTGRGSTTPTPRRGTASPRRRQPRGPATGRRQRPRLPPHSLARQCGVRPSAPGRC